MIWNCAMSLPVVNIIYYRNRKEERKEDMAYTRNRLIRRGFQLLLVIIIIIITRITVVV